MTHTPGPWTWGEKFEGLYGSGKDNIVLNHGAYDGMWLEYGKRQDANARLIAAAPDLLEALVYCLPYLRAVVPTPRNGVTADCATDINCIDRAIAAIAKAKGGGS